MPTISNDYISLSNKFWGTGEGRNNYSNDVMDNLTPAEREMIFGSGD